jgi:hypothetical protein
VPIDVHLMVRPVDRIVPDFAAAGASYISFHPEASEHVDRTIHLIREHGCKPGLVFNPATPLNWLDYTLDKLDLVLLMSVNPGFGGQQFIDSVLPKIAEVRRRVSASGRAVRVEVDGGIKVDNIAAAARPAPIPSWPDRRSSAAGLTTRRLSRPCAPRSGRASKPSSSSSSSSSSSNAGFGGAPACRPWTAWRARSPAGSSSSAAH